MYKTVSLQLFLCLLCLLAVGQVPTSSLRATNTGFVLTDPGSSVLGSPGCPLLSPSLQATLSRNPSLLRGLCRLLLSKVQLVKFSQLPASNQLYPRNASSMATIPIKGRVLLKGFDKVSMQVFRNATLYQYSKTPLVYADSTAPFSVAANIRAELAEFRIRIFVHQTGSTDSVQVADRQNIVAGDVFVVGGQSNATAYLPPPAYTYQSEYIRTFGVYANNDNKDPYNPADTLWTVGNRSPSTLVGVWEMEMARRITEQYGIPICIINGAAGGSGIEYLNNRNANNPSDLNTNYGRLLYRIKKAGLTGNIKAYFFRQGETETNGNAPAWPAEFEKLYKNVRLDYPEIKRFYLFQIHLLSGTLEATAVFRDYQRRAGSLLPIIQTHATVGTRGYDGVHFDAAGHVQTGAEIFRLVAYDFYGSKDTDQITSPNVRKVYYSTAAQNEIVIQFDEGQQMVWPKDTTVADATGKLLTSRLTQWLFLDKKDGAIVSGRAEGNRIILTLNGFRSERKIGYLPPNYPLVNGTGTPLPGYANAFPGPFIKNRRGLNAFSFWEVPIESPPAPRSNPVANLTSGSISNTPAQIDQATNQLISVQTGRWNKFTTWDWHRAITPAEFIRVNTRSSSVRISTGHVVSLEDTVIVKKLTLQGTLRLQPGGTIKLGQ